MRNIPGARQRFRIKLLIRATPQNRDIIRTLDAENEEDARNQLQDKYNVITFHWIKRIA